MATTTATTASPNLNMPAWDARMSGALKTNGNQAEDNAKLKKACQEMEGVFLNMLLKSMRATVPKSSLSGYGMQAETMQSMFDMEMTRNMASAGGTGIANMMYRDLTLRTSVSRAKPATNEKIADK